MERPPATHSIEAAARGDELAIAAIVAAHGALVFNTCLRVLSNREEAEDAAQATFILFLKKAPSLDAKTILAAWLHRSAELVARGHLRAARRRAAHEKEAAMQPQSDAGIEQSWQQLRPELDAAIAQLPERYRSAMVLAYMEGRSTAEAGAILGVPQSTVTTWLDRGRQKLRDLLARRGVDLNAAVMVTLLSSKLIETAPPASLAPAAILAAKSLAAGTLEATLPLQVSHMLKGALKMLFWIKIKYACILLAFCLFAGIATPLAIRAASEDKKETTAPVPAVPQPAPVDPTKPLDIGEIAYTGGAFTNDGKHFVYALKPKAGTNASELKSVEIKSGKVASLGLVPLCTVPDSTDVSDRKTIAERDKLKASGTFPKEPDIKDEGPVGALAQFLKAVRTQDAKAIGDLVVTDKIKEYSTRVKNANDPLVKSVTLSDIIVKRVETSPNKDSALLYVDVYSPASSEPKAMFQAAIVEDGKWHIRWKDVDEVLPPAHAQEEFFKWSMGVLAVHNDCDIIYLGQYGPGEDLDVKQGITWDVKKKGERPVKGFPDLEALQKARAAGTKNVKMTLKDLDEAAAEKRKKYVDPDRLVGLVGKKELSIEITGATKAVAPIDITESFKELYSHAVTEFPQNRMNMDSGQLLESDSIGPLAQSGKWILARAGIYVHYGIRGYGYGRIVLINTDKGQVIPFRQITSFSASSERTGPIQEQYVGSPDGNSVAAMSGDHLTIYRFPAE